KLNPQNRRYASIDAARFFCALLVVAIHVRPLETYTELGNFLLDKGLCRIAVPFFFLVSGFFWARKPMTVKSLGSFLGRILILYALWTAIYYPIVVESQNMTNYWRRCILSGSYYHLWYYPAMIVAVLLTWFGFRLLAPRAALTKPLNNRGGAVVLIALVCYAVGCMGESYYGFFADNEAVTTLAEKYFALFWSTRSGLFFGFFFFALGAYLQKVRWTMSRRKAAVALAISFALMAVEILTLRSFGVAKDYNLYFSLIPATLFLFLWLTGRPDRGSDVLPPKLCGFCRKSSVLIYGVHLWFKYYGMKWAQTIVADANSGWIGFADLFINNSLVQYLVISLLSLAFAAVVIGLQKVPFLKFLKYLY
ncbi:MAG: acyltransferase, partial [Firmicutes bacterium]|nr:acyltransferase [Bacillota bacterium]